MAQQTQGTLEREGFELGYCIEGTGIPTIVIGSSIYYPRTFSKNLEKKLQMVFMDHRGFGKALAPFTNASFELDILIDDIEALRQKLNLNQIAIIGHSGHAFIALEYAKKYPEHISHVVLIATSPSGNTFVASDQYFAESVCPERKTLYEKNMHHLKNEIDANPDKRFIFYSLRSGPRIWYDYQYDAANLWENVTVIPEMFDYVWGSLFKNIDITKNLENFNKPVLLMLGRYDYWNPPHLWEPLRSKFKNLTIRVFERSGHTPQLEEAALFDNELLNWLSLHT
ncbi:MAG TPA: alpha/beta hydrolase [Gammaproteobacteria bacterium]|nr:alpha/beta hydrolase [Gammaproteobacteria bacterium]